MMNVVSYKKAIELFTENFSKILKTETLPVDEAIGRVLSADVFSEENLPAYRRSTVDGYALNSKDAMVCSPSAPSVLKTVGSIEMGQIPQKKLCRGECMYIPTGGALPDGSDCVAMTEQTELLGDEAVFSTALSAMQNVVEVGEDFKKGDKVAAKGTYLSPNVASAIAGTGCKKVDVFKKLKYYIISTGDELVSYDGELPLGKIRDVNTILLSDASPLWECCGKARVGDDYELLKKTVLEATKTSDVVLLSGGSSVGKQDYTERLLSDFGEIFLRGVAIKPGKPTVAASSGRKMFIGLPGHPAAAFTVLKTVCLKAYEELLGMKERIKIRAISDINFAGGKGRTLIMPVRHYESADKLYFSPLFGKSGMAGSIASADGFAVVPDRIEGIDKGETLDIELL